MHVLRISEAHSKRLHLAGFLIVEGFCDPGPKKERPVRTSIFFSEWRSLFQRLATTFLFSYFLMQVDDSKKTSLAFTFYGNRNVVMCT